MRPTSNKSTLRWASTDQVCSSCGLMACAPVWLEETCPCRPPGLGSCCIASPSAPVFAPRVYTTNYGNHHDSLAGGVRVSPKWVIFAGIFAGFELLQRPADNRIGDRCDGSYTNEHGGTSGPSRGTRWHGPSSAPYPGSGSLNGRGSQSPPRGGLGG